MLFVFIFDSSLVFCPLRGAATPDSVRDERILAWIHFPVNTFFYFFFNFFLQGRYTIDAMRVCGRKIFLLTYVTGEEILIVRGKLDDS